MKRTGIRLQYNSPVVISFALLSLGALILGKLTHGAATTKFFSVYDPSLINVYFGYLDFDGCRLKLTEEGRDIANRIMSEFV